MLVNLVLALALVITGMNLAPAGLAPQPQGDEVHKVVLMRDVPDENVDAYRRCTMRDPHPVYRDLSNVPLIQPPSSGAVPNSGHHP
ncbi:MAG: hypothetical protein OXC42_08375 [Gammaproteobacteria bacterium]|nr:hypothetical protein [Gammaproteobacteria bacterium]